MMIPPPLKCHTGTDILLFGPGGTICGRSFELLDARTRREIAMNALVLPCSPPEGQWGHEKLTPSDRVSVHGFRSSASRGSELVMGATGHEDAIARRP